MWIARTPHWIPCPYGHPEDRSLSRLCVEVHVCGCDCTVHYFSGPDHIPIGLLHIVWCSRHDETLTRIAVEPPLHCDPHTDEAKS